MGTNLPSDFFSWRSFQSLTQTAALAWMLTLVIDVIFIQGMSDPYSQVVWLWIIGGVLCLLLAIVRLYFKEEKEKGDRFMVVFNAALIFLYASGFNGFTKELGSWSTINDKQTEAIPLKHEAEKSATSLASWVPNIFGNQTAFWPDVKMVRENQLLKVENRKLQELVSNVAPAESPDMTRKIQELERENERLRKQVAAGDNSYESDALQNMAGERDLAMLQLNTLLKRVDESNRRITEYNQLVKDFEVIKKQEDKFYSLLSQEFKDRGGASYVNLVTIMLNTQIDTNLPR